MVKGKKMTFKQRLNGLKNWFEFKKRMFLLWWNDAPRWQKDLEKGSYYFKTWSSLSSWATF